MAPWMPWMAFANAFDAQPRAFKATVSIKGFDHVIGASRVKATARSQ